VALVGGDNFTPGKAAVGEGEAIGDDLLESEVFVEVEGAVHLRWWRRSFSVEQGEWRSGRNPRSGTLRGRPGAWMPQLFSEFVVVDGG
jgi:hypothetical protein